MKKRIYLKILAVASLVWLSACVSTPSTLNVDKMVVREKFVTKTFDVRSFSEADISSMANEIENKGLGSVNLNVSYLIDEPDSRWEFKSIADKVKKSLIKKGIANVRVVDIPVDKPEQSGKLVISYKTKVAEAPEECTEMTGVHGAGDMEDASNYRISCGYKMNLSKMIADPSDLLGKADNENVESRRAGATVEKYKSGEANENLKGYQASEIGQQ